MGPKKGKKSKSKRAKSKAPRPPPEENYLKAHTNVLLIKESTMPPSMQKFAINVTKAGLEKFNTEQEIATHVKREFEATYGLYWQCVVGRNYGSYVSFDNYYTFFYLGKVGVVIYKNGGDVNVDETKGEVDTSEDEGYEEENKK